MVPLPQIGTIYQIVWTQVMELQAEATRPKEDFATMMSMVQGLPAITP